MTPKPQLTSSATPHHWGALVRLIFALGTVWSWPASAALFHSLIGAESGRIYTVTSDGKMLFYWHSPEDETISWLNNGIGLEIGSGWAGFPHVLHNGNGVIYAAGADGRLFYYRDLAQNGTASWANGGQGVEIGLGTGWASPRWVLAGSDGVLYVVEQDGRLMFYQHLTQDENAVWAFGGGGQQIGSGWETFRLIFSGYQGILYGIEPNGNLYYYRDRGRNGTVNWENNGNGLLIGNGWNRFKHVFSTGNGNIYAVEADGSLFFYHVTVTGTTAVWDIQNARLGSGFYPEVFQGYCWPPSAAPGETLSFRASARGLINVTFLRHRANEAGVTSVPMGNTSFEATVQPLPDDPVRDGCGWGESFSFTIPADWPSGIYSARGQDSEGFGDEIVFVVKPAPDRASGLAVLANINTWLAYNDWGGASKYTGRARVSFLRPNPSATLSGALHLTRGELWILGWLEDAGYQPDVYTDLDFHNDVVTSKARCLLLSTHPEYWSLRMYEKLQGFLARGGSLLYLGGNGIYENGEYSPDQTGMIFRAGVEAGPREAALFRTLSVPRPERALLGVATERCNIAGAPYRVQRATHPFFRGTGINNGDTIGTTGLNTGFGNGQAAAWEVDTSNGVGATGIPTDCFETSPTVPVGPGLPSGLMILATGMNWQEAGVWKGAEMTYYAHPGGGFVFSVGSITFGGSLVVDAALQRIVRNALTEAFANVPILSWGPHTSTLGTLTVHGRFGATYRLERSGDLTSSGSWQNYGNVVLDQDVTKNMTVPLAGPRGFFRLWQLP